MAKGDTGVKQHLKQTAGSENTSRSNIVAVPAKPVECSPYSNSLLSDLGTTRIGQTAWSIAAPTSKWMANIFR